MSRRVCTFAIAHTDIAAQPFNNATRTVRIFVPNNLNGTGIIVKFSNYYCAEPVWISHATVALSDSNGRLMPGTLRSLTVCGDTSFALVPDRDVFSDSIAMSVEPGQIIAVNLYYPSLNKVTSGNFVGLFAQRSVKGDYCEMPVLPKARLWSNLSRSVLPWDVSSAITTLSAVLVEQDDATPAPRVLAAFGDSIMQQGAWVTPFTERLYEKYKGEISVCNLGIGGNRLLHPSPPLYKGLYGHAGMERYHYDLLPLNGLTHVILALGTNDIGLPGKDAVPEDELISVQDYATALTTLVEDLRRQGVQKVFGALLLPREINHVYTEEREQLRLAINEWIRTSKLFDAVLNLGAPIADTDGIGMKKEFSMPDGLHPNKAGGKAIADAIDLTLFA
ncbi:MAG: GDSL-type esterase/lipase family protein [Ruthenibacterium sp.]